MACSVLNEKPKHAFASISYHPSASKPFGAYFMILPEWDFLLSFHVSEGIYFLNLC